MAEQLSPEGGAPTSDRLAVADYMLDNISKMLVERMKQIEAGEQIKATEASALTSELRKWAWVAIDERDRIAKRKRELDGEADGAVIDFDAARTQIGRRLARLRATCGSGSLPEGSE